MALFNTLLKASIARRVGLWAIVQSLPDEEVLANYLQRAYLGIAGVIIGSVLTGAAVAIGIVSLYQLMLARGIDDGTAIVLTTMLTLAIIITCFALAGRWFTQLAGIKHEITPLFQRERHGLGQIVKDSVNAVTDGFIEGLTNRKQSPSYAPRKNIRLIQ